MNRVRFLQKIALAASISLAMAFTLSCSDDKDESSSSGGYNGKGNDIANYGTVEIGTQTWMAENLNYVVEGSKCYEDDPANCDIYGSLYDWETALTVCPAGWHLPSDAEWQTLVDSRGGDDLAGVSLKAGSGWNNSGNGTNTSGFSALPGGYRYGSGTFSAVGRYGVWWSATPHDGDEAYTRGMNYLESNVSRSEHVKSDLYSVRCVKDE